MKPNTPIVFLGNHRRGLDWPVIVTLALLTAVVAILILLVF
ncbi:hypothetical protein SAMN04488498_110187 [Mesorhizobium albiziae]|uniref:Uncharacterized protein n=1 Tax=Neomesorhizobium albiziae TaxID=335020 RepID=A0A1I4BJB0_9HYPH|nr:hypothetical protein [Mesorhizobium albiziae]SFK68848.1 hypothetical protein SAMN04488498_110187 [Mesorhizobium albiziae]